jgi:hypothetical protein
MLEQQHQAAARKVPVRIEGWLLLVYRAPMKYKANAELAT